jgi:TatD DNase family protein
MELFDTHAHLDEEAFKSDRNDVVARAAENGVGTVITIGTTVASSRTSIELANSFPGVFAAVGIHPNYAAEAQSDDWQAIEPMICEEKVVAIGETGLDLYWDYAPLDIQQEYFRKHIELSNQSGLPFIVHCREAEKEVVAELSQAARSGTLLGVMHSFCGSQETAKACLEMGLYISFAGMLTYKKNDELRSLAATIPGDRLLVETDSP